MTPLIPAEDFVAPPERTRATLSPDGTRIAFLAPWKERLNIWVAGVDDLDAARCVTADDVRSIHDYSWADDRFLVYAQDVGGDEHFHVYRVDLDAPDAPAVDLTPYPGARVFGRDLPPGRPGTLVVWINHRRPDEIDTCEIDIATGELTVLVTGDGEFGGSQLAPGGDLYGVGQDDEGNWTVGHRAPSGEVRTIAVLDAADHPTGPFPVQLTPDGTGMWLGRHGHTDRLRLVRLDLATGVEIEVAGHPTHDVDTRAQVFPTIPSPLIRDRDGELLGVRYSRERQEIVPVTEEFAVVLEQLETLSDGDLGAISTDVARRRWLVSFVHDREWGATWLYDHATGDARPLFRTHAHLDPDVLAPTVPVTVRARDGRDLPSYLTRPLDAGDEPGPMVLVPHGGPWTRDSWGHDPIAQLFANRGYAVLQVNFRGSTGFGRDHVRAAIGEFAGAMQDDLVDAVEWAVTQGHADPARIGIFGGSYGGYATLTAVTRDPHLFAAAVDYVGISNLATFMLALPEAIRPGLRNNWYTYVGDPEDPAAYADMIERSPITHADRIIAPLMVFQGANDVRVPQSESDAIVASLRARGVEVAYRVYEDEGHMFAQTENLVDMFRATERFLSEHLGGRSG
ncbi:alpha/beta hydrolase family protein [Actinomycetospora termitidis]|uniref:S9 family peptidase n=1 Tax=Actinomycetospora termitidis TaxID=3053470 RepID=A0ABT7M1S2_9PSEU|nr:S9 family peptidase [Actinomycetospora sp. Odt1-22]MDL5154613.1 S9 family peptidase [Actinomycetospora sp. Odt1-22]